MLAQIGAFALPALLPSYIARWDLSKTEAGWLVGIFFAAYVVMVPILVALTDRIPARRVYMFGTGLTALAHLGFALVADGFWSGLVLRILAGIGWAGTYMPGLKAIADPLEGVAQSRAVSWHAAGVGISGAASFAIAGVIDRIAGPEAAFLLGAATAFAAVLVAAMVMPARQPNGNFSNHLQRARTAVENSSVRKPSLLVMIRQNGCDLGRRHCPMNHPLPVRALQAYARNRPSFPALELVVDHHEAGPARRGELDDGLQLLVG